MPRSDRDISTPFTAGEAYWNANEVRQKKGWSVINALGRLISRREYDARLKSGKNPLYDDDVAIKNSNTLEPSPANSSSKTDRKTFVPSPATPILNRLHEKKAS